MSERPVFPLLASAAGLLVLAGAAWAQGAAPAVAPAQPVVPQPRPSVSTQTPIKPATVRVATPKVEAKPTWAELTPQQQQSLAPLTATWRSLTEAHKRKWLALSENYPTMPPGEQARLHSRMAEWAALSPQQRTQARLNFAETQKLPPTTNKRAQWEAYQALSPEEKRKLAAGAEAAKPPPTAVAEKPAPAQKITRLPKPAKKVDNAARIAVAPGQVNQNTLLPQPGALPSTQP